MKSCPHWRVFFFFLGQRFPPPHTHTFHGVLGPLGDILLVCSSYRRGQWAGHRAHPNLGFSLLFRLLSFGCACPLCVLAKGETLLHRACKRNQVETVFKILALPGTDVNVKGKVFLTLPRLLRNFCTTTVSVH